MSTLSSQPATTGQPGRRRSDFASQRRTIRLPLPETPARIDVVQRNQPTITVRGRGLDISATGARVLVQSFVYTNMLCAVTLTNLQGKPCRFAAATRWCDYELQRGHHVGVEFRDLIDPRDFVPAPIIEETISTDLDKARPCRGRVAVAVGQPNLRVAVLRELESPNIRIQLAESSDRALKLFLDQPIDMLVTDRALGTAGEGGGLVASWRALGFTGPVMLVGEADDLDLMTIAARLHADEIIRRPWTGGRIHTAVMELLEAYPLREGEGPIFSTVEAIFGTPKPVRKMICKIQEEAGVLVAAQRAGNSEAMTNILRAIALDATEGGFPGVASLAQMVCADAGEQRDTQRSFDTCRRLVAMTGRMSCRADRVVKAGR